MSPRPVPPPRLLLALASDLLDYPGHLRTLLEAAQAEGRQAAEFNFNITDLTVDLVAGSAEIADVLDGDAETVSLSIDRLMRPFDFSADLEPRLLAFAKREFGMQWREAVVWLAQLPETSQNLERVVAAAIVQSHGQLDELAHAIQLGHTDFRDLLVNGGMADEDWRTRLDQLLLGD